MIKETSYYCSHDMYIECEECQTEREALQDVVEIIEKVRCKPGKLNGREYWAPGTLQVWKDLHEKLAALDGAKEGGKSG